MKTTLIILVALIVIGVVLGIFGITISNNFKDKITRIDMVRASIKNLEGRVIQVGDTPQAIRTRERQENETTDLVYAYNLQVAEYNSMANRLPYSFFRGSYPVVIEKYKD